MTHCELVLRALRDGKWHTTAALYREVSQPMILHSRISDLRAKGHNVEGRHVPGKTGADGYEYRLVAPAPQPLATSVRCPEDTDGNQCIYEQGHKGQHFAKDEWSYYMWTTPKARRQVVPCSPSVPAAEHNPNQLTLA